MCAVCRGGHVLSGAQCVSCPTSSGNGPLVIAYVATALLIFVGVSVFTMQPAVNHRIRLCVARHLANGGVESIFQSSSGEIKREDFVHALQDALQDLYLDDFQLQKIFDEIDADGSGGLTQEELAKYAKEPRHASRFSRVHQAWSNANEIKDEADGMQEGATDVIDRAGALSDSMSGGTVGSACMKFKLILGFGQCLSYFPVAFDSIPWPKDLTLFMKSFEVFSLDIFSFVGASACQLESDYVSKFYLHMTVPLAILLICVGSYMLGRTCIEARKSVRFSKDSLASRMFMLLTTGLYTVYVGVSIRIFRLFKCREIQGIWYLTADYSIECFSPAWTTASAVGITGIALFVIGIPVAEFALLFVNRKYLYGDKNRTKRDDKKRHQRVKQMFGSLYKDYRPDSYYFDILDVCRRLLLTGGLIMAGEEAVAQVFLGILLSVLWLVLISYRRPYVSSWDNILSMILSLSLVLTLVAGMAMRLYKVSDEDADMYRRRSFGAVLIATLSICLALSVTSLVVSTECVRDRIFKRRRKAATTSRSRIAPRISRKQPELAIRSFS